jgi:PIN domain nuclease of toxin-antitoxin system
LDTHFVIWIVTRAERTERFPWLDEYRPWGLSPVTLLEIQYLHEIGRLEVDQGSFANVLVKDPRFVVDDPTVLNLVRKALRLTWTRDPFDRLLAAHSEARKLPLCTVDRNIRTHHRHLLDRPEVARMDACD